LKIVDKSIDAILNTQSELGHKTHYLLEKYHELSELEDQIKKMTEFIEEHGPLENLSDELQNRYKSAKIAYRSAV